MQKTKKTTHLHTYNIFPDFTMGWKNATRPKECMNGGWVDRTLANCPEERLPHEELRQVGGKSHFGKCHLRELLQFHACRPNLFP